MQMDGDKTTIFHDVDGSVSEYPGAFLVKEDNWLLRHPDCIDVPDWRAAICSGRFAQVRAWSDPHDLVTTKYGSGLAFWLWLWIRILDQLGFFTAYTFMLERARTHAHKL